MKHKSNHPALLGSFQYVHPARYVTMLLFFTTLVVSCAAQSDTVTIAVPVTIVSLVTFGMCGFVVCIMCCIIVKNRNMQNPRTTFNAREVSTQQVIYSHSTPASGGSQPYPAQSNYPQTYPAPPQTYPVPSQTYPVPPQLAYTEPQQVSLPEATLHQGDAPPGYTEAVVMTTVAVNGQQTVAAELPSK